MSTNLLSFSFFQELADIHVQNGVDLKLLIFLTRKETMNHFNLSDLNAKVSYVAESSIGWMLFNFLLK